MDNPAEVAMRAALIRILFDAPALGDLAMAQTIRLDTTVSGIARDGDVLRFNPDHVNRVSRTTDGAKTLADEITALLEPRNAEVR